MAPILNPCAKDDGTNAFSELNPKRYKWLEIPTEVVSPTSIGNQSIFSSTLVSALGGIIDVIYALSSLSKDSFLNPEELNAIWPKLELEFVILKSPPVSASKCLLNPIANTETTWINASFEILIWLDSHPLR